MPLLPLPLLGTPGVGTVAAGGVGSGAIAASTAAATISLSTIASWGLVGGALLSGFLTSPEGVDGPRLTDFTVHQSNYGVFRPITKGRFRTDGNVIWMAMPVEREIKQRAGLIVQQTVARFYEYYGSWAVGLGEPCDTVTRVWLGGQVWFDATGADWEEWIRAKRLLKTKDSPWEEELAIYNGSEDQEPDPFMESIEGEGEVPAYRGEAYLRFKNVLLTYDFGNQTPSCSAEKAEGAHRITAWDKFDPEENQWSASFQQAFLNGLVFANDNEMHLFRYSNDPNGLMGFVSEIGDRWDFARFNWTFPYNRILNASTSAPSKPMGAFVSPENGHRIVVASAGQNNAGLICDVEANSILDPVINDPDRPPVDKRQQLFPTYQPDLFPRFGSAMGVSHNGLIICYGGENQSTFPTPPYGDRNGCYRDLWTSPDGINWTKKQSDGGAGYRVGASIVHNGSMTLMYGGKETENASPEHNAVYQYNAETNVFSKIATDLTGLGQDNAQVLGGCFFKGLFTALVCRTSDNAFIVYQSNDGVAWKPMGDLVLPIVDVNQASKTFSISGDRRFSINENGRFWIDGSTGNDGEFTIFSIEYNSILDRTIVTVNESISDATADGDLRHYPMADHLDATGFDCDNRPAVCVFWDELWILGGSPVNRIAKTKTTFVFKEVTVEDFIETIAARCDIDSSNINASDLSGDLVEGHSITQLSDGKSHLVPLQRAFFFDYVFYDGVLHCLKRGKRTPIAISEEEIGAMKDINSITNKVDARRLADLDLPSRIDLVFHDSSNDFQPGSQSAERQHFNAESTQTVNLPVAMTDEYARLVAETLLWDSEAERQPLAFQLTYAWSMLTPGDVLTFSVEGTQYTVRLTKVDVDDLIVQCQALPENIEIYNANPLPLVEIVRASRTLRKPTTFFSFLDIPAFQTLSNNDYGFWLAAAPSDESTDWPGCELRVKHSDSSEFAESIPIGKAACMGNADSVLPAPVYVSLPDNKNYVDVEIVSGANQLENASEALQLADANLGILGDEILSFGTATPLGNNVYRLSSPLYRGLYGSEWAVHTHRLNERFVLLNNVVRIPLSKQFVNVPLDYQIVTAGQSVQSNSSLRFTCKAISQKPLSPAFLEAERLSDSAWKIQWLGRSRGPLQSDMESGRPTVDGVEEYEIDFIDETAYPIVSHDPLANLLRIEGEWADQFPPNEMVRIDGLLGRDSKFTIASSQNLNGSTILETIENLAGLPDGSNVRRILHVQRHKILDFDPGKKAFFELPVQSFDRIDADGSVVRQYGQDEIYGGAAASIRISVAQIEPVLKRGYETENSFSV